MGKVYCTAIVLAAGSGKRMGSKVHKQYLLIGGRPVLYYSLKAFQDSELIDEIILVTGSGEEEYCHEEIVKKYGISKVNAIVSGGTERYHSVWCGLRETKDGYVYIHDGARPFVDEEIIRRGYECVAVEKACAAGMPSKDTVKIADEKGFVTETPNRSSVWTIQTPQIFDVRLVKDAYSILMKQEDSDTLEKQEGIEPDIEENKTAKRIFITDDAMVVEQMLGYPVRLFEGSYENIKITTPEDLQIAEVFLRRMGKVF